MRLQGVDPETPETLVFEEDLEVTVLSELSATKDNTGWGSIYVQSLEEPGQWGSTYVQSLEEPGRGDRGWAAGSGGRCRE